MSYEFREARPENIPLLIGFAGGTGSGKTYSAMKVAKGIAGGRRFAVIDTENGRAKHYADDFSFDVADLSAPFRPAAYADAIQAADKQGYPVIVVDSMSHEWAGDGGCLDWHDELMGGDNKKKLTAWIEPKQAHRKMVTRLLQVSAHVILCFRASERVEVTRDANGRMEIVAKKSLNGLDGWIPITEKDLPFELTLSVLLAADRPGVPRPIKLPERLRPFIPLDAPLGEESGRALGEWAAGTKVAAAPVPAAPEPEKNGVQLFADAAVEIAAQLHPPADVEGVSAEAAAMTLQKIFELGEQGETWLRWAAGTARDRWPEEFGASLELFVSARLGVPA